MGVAKTIETVFEALLKNRALRLLCAFALAVALVPAVASNARADEEGRAGASGGSIESSLDTYAFDKYPAVADTEERGTTYNIWAYYTPSNDEAESFYAHPEEERGQDGNFTVKSSNDGVAKVVPSEGGYGFDLTFPGVGEATISISYSYEEFSAKKEYVVKAVAEENPVSSITLSKPSVDIEMPECPICKAIHECGYAYVDCEMVARDSGNLVTQFDLWAETESGDEDIFVSWTKDGKLVVEPSAAFQGSELVTVKVASQRNYEDPNDVWATAELTLNTTPAEFSVEASPLTIELDGSRSPLCSSASDEESSAPFVFNEAFESANAYHTGVADALVESVSSSNLEAVGIFSYSIPAGDGVTVYFLEAKRPGTSTVTMTDILGNSHTALITVSDNSVPATGITLSGVKTAMNAGETQLLTAAVTPSDSTDAIVWSSSDESVLKVSQGGVVEAIGNGSATVTVTAGTVSATTDLITVTTKLAGLSFGVENLSLSVGGKSSQLTPVFTPSTASNQNVTWSSSNDSVATVDQNGLVTPHEVGEAYVYAISAEDSSLIARCVVKVSQPVEGVTLDKSEASLRGKKSVQLIATVHPTNASNKDLIWSSSDSSVATVDQTGLVTSVSEGKATITAKSADGSYQASCEVSVLNALANVEVQPSSLSMVKGASVSVTFAFTGELPGAIYADFGWGAKGGLKYQDGVFVDSSTGSSVCKMEKIRDGGNHEIGATFEALGTGSGIIELDFEGGFTKEIFVSVSNPVQSVSVSSSAEALEVGQAFDLSATISPSDADDADVVWSSSNKKVASVDESGRVSAMAAGEAVITASTPNGKSAQCVVTVKAKDVVSTAPSSEIKASVEASSAEELETVNGILSSLAGDDGAKVELVVEASENLPSKAASAVKKIQDGGKLVAAVVDARFEVNGEEVAFNTEGKEVVTIKIEMTDEMKALDPSTIVVVYVGEDGEVEEMPTWVSGGYLYFKTTHFSTYAVTGSLPSVDIPEGPAASGPASSEKVETVIAATGDSAGRTLAVMGIAGVLSGVIVALMRRRLA